MFLTIDDYHVIVCPQDLDILTQSSEQTRLQAERTAMEEVAGYLRSRFDIDKAYAQTDISRNFLLVQMTVSIAVYYMALWLPQFMAYEKYETLYNSTLERLREIQKGTFTPDLPGYEQNDSNSGNSQGDAVIFGSMPKQTYDY